MAENQDKSLEALKEIRSIMHNSTKFVSLSGVSGVWAGFVALAGSAYAYYLLNKPDNMLVMGSSFEENESYFDPVTRQVFFLAIGIFVVALAGAFYFTQRKSKSLGQTMWNHVAKQMIFQGFFPMAAGAILCLRFIYFGYINLIAPSCLIFYGLAVISASKFTHSEVKYLGIMEVTLGCIALTMTNYGLYYWAAGFGVLHIVYGLLMWNKYDRKPKA